MDSLKKINQQLALLMDDVAERPEEYINAETGEIRSDLLDALQMARTEKLENIIKYIVSARAEVQAIKEEITRLTGRMKRTNKTIEWLIDAYLPNELGADETFHCADGDIKRRKSSAVCIEDETKIPEKYTVMTKKYDKAEMLRVLRGGAEIAGVRLEERERVVVK